MSLARAQTEQAAIKSTMSPLISGHQNLRWMNDRVLLVPGWPENWDECPHSITRALQSAGTNWMPSGQPLGVASDPTASLTSSSMSIWTALAKTSGLENGLRRFRGLGTLEVAGEGVRLNIL